ncbi:MAG: peptidase M48 [Odoribacter sp. 43_10]|nr:MAG: peptidase M48 [Odoribacter sp. 43_10]
MKKWMLVVLVLAGSVSWGQAQIKIGNRTINTKKVLNAASEVASAITSVKWMDEQNPVSDPGSAYSKRLDSLMKKVGEVEGLKLNYKVYEVVDINAFACGDGSIRVFSALMDLMDDDELMAVIGHEIGHVVHTDSKDAMKNAYLAAAAKSAAGAAGGVLEKLTDSQLGEIAQALSNAQFSQKQETEADEYGFEFCIKHGFDPYGMANALEKLNNLSEGQKASKFQQMFSSHPDSAKRASRMKEKADAYLNK